MIGAHICIDGRRRIIFRRNTFGWKHTKSTQWLPPNNTGRRTTQGSAWHRATCTRDFVSMAMVLLAAVAAAAATLLAVAVGVACFSRSRWTVWWMPHRQPVCIHAAVAQPSLLYSVEHTQHASALRDNQFQISFASVSWCRDFGAIKRASINIMNEYK